MKKTLLILCLTLALFSYSQVAPVGSSSTFAPPPNISYDTKLTTYNNEVYFQGGFINGIELLKVNASDNLIYQVRDINPGFLNSNPESFYVSPSTNEMYFSAINGADGAELWKTDGTLSGTILAADLAAGSAYSFPNNMLEMNNRIFMAANSQSFGIELTIYNIQNQTHSVVDIVPGGLSSSPSELTAYGDLIIYSANINNLSRILFVYNTVNNTNSRIYIGGITNNSAPEEFIVFNNKVYFTAKDNTNGRELWVTDGTVAGTYMVSDINTGIGSSNPSNFKIYGNKLYFAANSPNSGRELYRMEANEAVLFYKDINPGADSGSPSNFEIFNGRLYFSADNGNNGEELWSTNGSVFGISLFKDINTSGDSSPRYPIVYNNKLYFVADDGNSGRELWATDGTSNGTSIIADINTSGSSEPRKLVVAGNRLYFHADNGTNRRIWNYIDPTLSIENSENPISLSIYPNPTKNYFTIQSNHKINRVEIADINGKIVKTYTKASENYDISELSNGIYIIKIQSDANTNSIKLIKN